MEEVQAWVEEVLAERLVGVGRGEEGTDRERSNTLLQHYELPLTYPQLSVVCLRSPSSV